MIAAIAAIALTASALAISPPLSGLRGLSLDVLTAFRWDLLGNRHSASESPVVVIALDPETYRAPPFAGTPTVMWTREIGRVLTAVLEGGAKVVGFDIVFPTSIEESAISTDGDTVGARMRGFDRDFLRALALGARQNKIVLGAVQHGEDSVQPARGQRAAVGQQDNVRSLNVYSDADGIVRRAPLMLNSDAGMVVPSMSLELASRALGATPRRSANGAVTLSGYPIPTYPSNAMTLDFDGGLGAIPTYSFADLHACVEKGDPAFFRRNFADKVVLIGSTLDFEDDKMTSKRFANGPRDGSVERCATPARRDPAVPRRSIDGVYIHATAVDNLLRREVIDELGDLSRWAVAFVAAALAALTVFLLTPAKATLSLLALAMLWALGAVEAFQHSIGLPLLEPLVAAAIALVATVGFRLFVSDREKRFLRKTFELYLAPAVIEKMVTSSRPPNLGGEMRNITVFFSDLVGFSSIAEKMKPADLVVLMNGYLSAMTDVIERHGGFVDKYIGDGIVALFGAPNEDADNAVQAVRAALECQTKLDELNLDAMEENGPRLRHRIGLNSGQALVGNIGSRRRFNYTVVGDVANLASRLEGACKYFGTTILASGATMALTADAFVWREVDDIRVKGRVEVVSVYEPLCEKGQLDLPQLAHAKSYSQGLARWRSRDFVGATVAFSRWAEADAPARLFKARAEKLSLNPPGAEWEPIQTLQEK